VRLIQELDGVQAELAVVQEPAQPALLTGLPALRSPRAFGALMRQALRNAAVVLFAVGLMSAAGAGGAEAQVAAGIAEAAQAPTAAQVDAKLPELAPQIDVRVGQGAGGLRLSGTVGVVVMMGLMTLLPTLLLMMTGFTRILIVLHFLRQALGTQSAPPGQLLAALALLLTGFVMAPTLSKVNETALQPWMNGQIEQAEMLATGVQPFREFMFAQVRESDVTTFLAMSSRPRVATVDEVPLVVLMSAFVTSELRTAFQIGFALFLPFIVIDVVVAAVLMSMGMMMLPPAMISLPFKILLFVLVDGWALIAQGLVTSFR
jgi:flagellar biosynthetic protein FliP